MRERRCKRTRERARKRPRKTKRRYGEERRKRQKAPWCEEGGVYSNDMAVDAGKVAFEAMFTTIIINLGSMIILLASVACVFTSSPVTATYRCGVFACKE